MTGSGTQRSSIGMTAGLVIAAGALLSVMTLLVAGVVSRVTEREFKLLAESARAEHAGVVSSGVTRFLDDRFTLLEDHARNSHVVQGSMDPDSDQSVLVDALSVMSMIGEIQPMGLYDFEGELICGAGGFDASVATAGQLDGILNEDATRSLVVFEGHRGWQWVLLVPVRYHSSIEGVLAVTVPIEDALADLENQDHASFGVVLRYGATELARAGGFAGSGSSSVTTVALPANGVVLDVELDASSVHEAKMAIEKQVLSAMAFTSSIGCVLLLWVSRRLVIVPIRQLQRRAGALAAGEKFLNVRGRARFKELQSLEISFTEMSEAVLDRERSLSELNAALEGRVATRTAELHDALEVAQRADQAKSEFLANMSHEIRTPMTAILGYADLLGGDSLEDECDADDAVRTIRSNASHLLTIINDILDVSKIEAGQMTVERISMRPVQIIEEVASLVGPRARGKGVEVKVSYDSLMPESIHCDPTRLRQILLNLMGNAIKFTEVGNVTIHASCDTDREIMRFVVADTGIGMNSEQVEQLSRFEAFTQADASVTRRFGGSGLGLRISNALAGLLGGSLAIESEPGEGSRFTVEIETGSLSGVPMIQPEHIEQAERDSRTTASSKEAQNLQRALVGVRVLLAEDGLDNQRLVSFHLKRAGAEIVVCDNGLIAAETIEAGESLPDVVLMDMQMPELDGYGATRRLRRGGFDLPIVALTAHAMEGDRQKCIEAGCDDYLTKPIDKKVLIATCARLASKGRSRRVA